jgi:type VI secretion system secreted protein VgrG
MAISLDNRTLQLQTPLGKDVLLPERIEILERLSQPFQWNLALLSESGELNSDDILGKDVTLSYKLPTGHGTRYFNGFVTEFSQSGYRKRLHEYRATARPWLWFLTRTADCRIFQHKSVPAIFEQVVKHYGFTGYRLKLSGNHPAWDYCVQYRETDFNFISRLLEQEGIHYFFEHSAGRHVMVLCDDSTTLGTVTDYAEVPYFSSDAGAASPRDHFDDWSVSRSVQPGVYVTSDFDFEAPRKSLLARATTKRKYARGDFEMFDFPAESPTLQAKETEQIAKLRLEELQSGYMVAQGHGDVAGVAPGWRFKLTEHPRKDMNINYLVTGARYVLDAPSVDAGSSSDGIEFVCNVEAIDARTAYRPPRVTPKPVIQGSQSAMVVGKSGVEIDTDKYGRVRVQFPWDRYGNSDENSSCWIRVAQVWAGKNWGSIHTPRIGEEVLVSFLEGDPDRPIITGRVYNADAMPPYDLPANATQYGIKTRSSQGGSSDNFNEIRFEDKKGAEHLHIHAEKDLSVEVENDRSVTVQHDETVKIDHDRKSSIGNNETCDVSKDHETTIGQNEKRSVGQDRKSSISGKDELTVGKDATSDIAQKYILTAGQEITLQTGASKLVMKSDGTIQLQGVNIKIEGSQSIANEAGSQVTVKGMQIQVSGTTVEVKGTKTSVEGTLLDLNASGIATLKGGLTKIG